MINLKPIIYNKLKETGINVSYFFPEDFTHLPVITYYELDNRATVFAFGEELETEITFTVDIWSNESTSDIAIDVDIKMKSLGFARIAQQDLYENDTKIHHKSLQYARRVTNNNIIYQEE